MRSGAKFANNLLKIGLLALLFCNCKEGPTEPDANRPPSRPTSPVPADGAADQSVWPLLSWVSSDPDHGDSTRFDVYLDSLNTPRTMVAHDLPDPSYTPALGLMHSTTYHWFVVAKDTSGDSAIGSVWEFVTAEVHRQGEEHSFPLGGDGLMHPMVWIPAGSFTMGSPTTEPGRQEDEGPEHRVTFDTGFWIGKYELTQGEWEAIMGFNISSDQGVGPNYPVNNATWDDAQWFISELGGTYRLPSEAEWEYACRAGSSSRYHWGADPGNEIIPVYAWFTGNSHSTAHPVGSKSANAWGLHDMAGNVYEWCEDWYHPDYSGAPSNGVAWLTPVGENRVSRGGSWLYFAESCRSANRTGKNTDASLNDDGFRLVRDD